jgi:enterochelin esterase family protein
MADATSPRIEQFEKAAAENVAAAVDALNADRRAAQGPLVEPADDPTKCLVTFIVDSASDAPVSITSSLFPVDFTAPAYGTPLTRVPGTDIWYASIVADRRVSTTYSFLADPPAMPDDPMALASDKDALLAYMRAMADAAVIDPYNPDRMLSQSALMGDMGDRYECVLTLPDADPFPWWDDAPAPGEVHTERFTSAILSNERDVTVYTPPGFDPAAGPYPAVVLLDGEAVHRIAGADRILDNLIGGGHIPPMLAIFVNNVDAVSRMFEMACNTPFANLIADELLPWARERYPISTDPKDIAVGGASYGGLASNFIGFARPDAVGNVISMSASMWFGEMVDGEAEWLTRQFVEPTAKPVRFWVDVGSLEDMVLPQAAGVTMISSNRHFRDVLRAKGYEVVGYKEQPGGHDLANWRRTLPEALRALFGPARA